MREWLPVAAVLPLIAGATAAHAQTKGLAPTDVATVARTRALDLRLMQQKGYAPAPSLMGGMIAQRDLSSSAFVGVGLARMYSRKKRGDMRVTDQPTSGRKPAVTFVVKF